MCASILAMHIPIETTYKGRNLQEVTWAIYNHYRLKAFHIKAHSFLFFFTQSSMFFFHIFTPKNAAETTVFLDFLHAQLALSSISKDTYTYHVSYRQLYLISSNLWQTLRRSADSGTLPSRPKASLANLSLCSESTDSLALCKHSTAW